MTPLKSSAIVNSDYDLAAEQLTLTFRDGTQYTYNGVPQEIAQGLTRAESAGKYFQDVIRNNYVGAKQEDT